MPLTALLTGLVLLTTTGCTLASLGGRFADWYAMRRIDEQVDLSREQRAYLEPRVTSHVQWLKQDLLPVVATSLDGLIERVEKGVTGEDVAWLEQLLDGYKNSIHQRVNEDTIWLLSNLSSDQIKYMDEKRLDRIKTADKRLSIDEDKYRKRRFEHYEDLSERYLGDISDDQKQMIHTKLAALATIEHAKIYEHGRSAVSELLITVATPPVDREKLGAFIADWVSDPAKLRPEIPEKQYRERMQLIRELILDLAKTMTPTQKTHFVNEIRKLQKHIRAFAAS